MKDTATSDTFVASNLSVRYYCTLFNKNYLIKGLAMYRSLEMQSGHFVLYVLCMDDESHDVLSKMNVPSMRLIKLVDIETDELLKAKSDRTIAEYCWTCAPCLLSFVFDKHAAVDFLTYLDADLLFFSSPEPIYEEAKNSSSIIVEHRFSPRFEPSIINGKYNVQWVSIKRDKFGLDTLIWWRDRCIEWCYYRLENDRMGDQKYLDQWTTKFKQVHELQHIGAGLAPWNFANYSISERDNQIYVDDKKLIFYHFHSFRMLKNKDFVPMPSVYTEFDPVPDGIYCRYNAALLNSLSEIQTTHANFSAGIERIEDQPISKPTTNNLLIKNKKSFLKATTQKICRWVFRN